MTTPGKTLRESVTRLADVIDAARATSEENRQRVVAQETPAVRIGQEVDDDSDSGEQGPA